MSPTCGLRRWLVFNGVGAIGAAVQLAVLGVLVHAFHVHVLVATAIAVEAAIVHNFLWHQRWTWRDRPINSVGLLLRFAGFHVLNGGVSLVGNLAVMHVLTGRFGIDPLTANAGAVIACSVVNFCSSELLVFRAARVTAAGFAATLLMTTPVSAHSADALAIELRPGTLAAWRAYEQKVDERYHRVTADGSPFLAHDEFRLSTWRDVVRGGGIAMAQVESPMPGTPRPSIPDGRIHHWIGAVFVPGVTVADVVRRLRDRAGHEAGAYDDVLSSKLLRRDGDELTVYLKLRRQSVITVVYNTEHAVVYRRLGDARATSRSVATKIAELADPGTPQEREKPAGSDRGFLWRLNAYWRYEQVDGGVVIECESISLSRGVPTLLRPFISGVVDGIARDALEKTLKGVRTVTGG
jgi:putative flippase GtrA